MNFRKVIIVKRLAFLALLTRKRRFNLVIEIVPKWSKEAYLPLLIVTSSKIYSFVLYMARGGIIFRKNFKFQKNFHFVLLHSIFYVITPPETLKGSRNIRVSP